MRGPRLGVMPIPAEEALGLPSGPRELPLMIADRAFDPDGGLACPALDPSLRERPGVHERCAAGVLGDVILVHGAPWPVHEVDAARYRLRIPRHPPATLAPAERYDVVVDFTDVPFGGG